MAIDAKNERMDCVNLATLLFHTGEKNIIVDSIIHKNKIAARLNLLKGEEEEEEQQKVEEGEEIERKEEASDALSAVA